MKFMSKTNGFWMAGLLTLGAVASSATQAEGITCPTKEQIKHYYFHQNYPLSFDSETHTMLFFAYLRENEKEEPYEGWNLSIQNMHAGKDDDLMAIMNDTIDALEPVSLAPFQYTNSEHSSYKMPICYYIVPGDNSIFAEAFLSPQGESPRDPFFAALHTQKRGH